MKIKKLITVQTIITFSVFSIGCYVTREYQKEDIGKIKGSQNIERVTTQNGNVIRFDSDSTECVKLNDRSIDELSRDGIIKTVPIDSVKSIHTKDFSVVLTTLSTVGFIGVAGLVYIEILRSAAGQD